MGNTETLTSIKFKSMKAHHIDDERINKNHRFLESQNGLGWKGPLRSSSTTPCYRQGPLPLDQVAQRPILPGLEHLQGWVTHSFSWQPVPVPYHPLRKEFISNI